MHDTFKLLDVDHLFLRYSLSSKIAKVIYIEFLDIKGQLLFFSYKD